MPTRLMQVHEQRSGDKPVLPQPFDFSCQARPSEKTPYAYRRPRREIWEWRDHTRVKKGLAEPHADTRRLILLPVDMAAD